MSLFSKSKDAGDAAEASVVFEVERGYGDRLFGKAKPVAIYVDGSLVASLQPGESFEAKVMTGKRKFTFAHKDGKSSVSKNIDGDIHCYIKEDREDGTEINWANGGGALSFVNGEKKASTGSKEVKVFFRAEAGLTGRDRKVDISIDGIHVATLGTGERHQHALDTGTHTFQFNDEFSRQVIQQDTGCFIQLGRKIEYEFFDPKSIMGKTRLRREPFTEGRRLAFGQRLLMYSQTKSKSSSGT